MWLAAAFCATLVAACTPTVDHRGYVAKPGAFDHISNGMSKTEVESILGSPSTSASVNLQGDSYYYITSITERRTFLAPKETEREVIAIRFDKNDQVQSFAQYGLQDGRVIDVNSGKSVVMGEDTSILSLLLKTGGSATPGPMLGRKL
jgi:outer membrane protein assembly factor BamE (lipoprotein component of BamABCDE complex)